MQTLYKVLRIHRRLPRSFVSPMVKGLRLPEDPGRTRQVTIEDVKKLVSAARLSNNRKLPAMIAVACTTGLRKGAIQAITWGDVDLKTRTIDVSRTKNGTPTRSVLPDWAAAELARIRPLILRRRCWCLVSRTSGPLWMKLLNRSERRSARTILLSMRCLTK